ncbi:hypothetical protein KIL84_001386 [Mauremys mutica]|uniref:Uncharacterized protein n=1 Tax=Mauremys mutica TaxID=74926 RepID=A0A9D4AVN9_9SAUR|nr:hypothetical protein KIL84_001386 [Mauremys mutica]
MLFCCARWDTPSTSHCTLCGDSFHHSVQGSLGGVQNETVQLLTTQIHWPKHIQRGNNTADGKLRDRMLQISCLTWNKSFRFAPGQTGNLKQNGIEPTFLESQSSDFTTKATFCSN